MVKNIGPSDSVNRQFLDKVQRHAIVFYLSVILRKIAIYIHIFAISILSKMGRIDSSIEISKLRDRITDLNADIREFKATEIFPELLVPARNKPKERIYADQGDRFREAKDLSINDIIVLAKKGLCSGGARALGEKFAARLREGPLSKEEVMEMASEYQAGVPDQVVLQHIRASYHDALKTKNNIQQFLVEQVKLSESEKEFAAQIVNFLTNPSKDARFDKKYSHFTAAVMQLIKSGEADGSHINQLIEKHVELLGSALADSLRHLVDKYVERIQWIIRDSRRVSVGRNLDLDELVNQKTGVYKLISTSNVKHTTLFINSGKGMYFWDIGTGLYELDPANPKEVIQRVINQYYPGFANLMLAEIKPQ